MPSEGLRIFRAPRFARRFSRFLFPGRGPVGLAGADRAGAGGASEPAEAAQGAPRRPCGGPRSHRPERRASGSRHHNRPRLERRGNGDPAGCELDLPLIPASAGISVRDVLTVRNDGAAPLPRLILDITSSTHWDAFSTRTSTSAVTRLPFATHLVATDADHTGQMSEAVITLPQPLAPGASFALTALYSGAIPQTSERLPRIGAPAARAFAEDWDAIAPNNPDAPAEGTALRGFGYVLWYPVSAPPVFLGDGARLFQAVGSIRLRESAATIRLRLAVEYVGEPPDAAFFCGQREQLLAISDNPNLPVAESPGIATATFDLQPITFRMPSLFIAGHAATDVGTQANPGLFAAVTAHDQALPAYYAAAALVEPLLTDWFGPHPPTALTHP